MYFVSLYASIVLMCCKKMMVFFIRLYILFSALPFGSKYIFKANSVEMLNCFIMHVYLPKIETVTEIRKAFYKKLKAFPIWHSSLGTQDGK